METVSSRAIHANLLAGMVSTRIHSIYTGKYLYELKENDAWQSAVGDGLESWQSYLAQPEIGLTVGEANRLMKIYKVFVLSQGFSEEDVVNVPPKNLLALLPIAQTEVDINDLFADAQHLSPRDFKERLQDVKSNDDGVRTYEYVLMRKCKETGTIRKVHEFSSSDVDIMIQRYQDG